MLGITFESIRRGGSGSWRVTWSLRNTGAAPVTVLEAWHPHGRFHSSRRPRSLRIAPGRSASLAVPARTDAGPGAAVENCFLILRVRSGRRDWRILARFTLRVSDDGTPAPRIEAVDAHPARR